MPSSSALREIDNDIVEEMFFNKVTCFAVTVPGTTQAAVIGMPIKYNHFHI